MEDPRIVAYRDAALQMAKGHFKVDIPVQADGAVSELGLALLKLAKSLELNVEQIKKLLELTAQVNAGLLLGEVLNNVFDSFRPTIPYDRIGLALLDDGMQKVTARWCRSDSPEIKLGGGYSAPLQGSSLQKILDTGQPRILNDLPVYLQEHPDSDATRKIVEEGMCSSLTCPLIAMGKPIGFIFFSSLRPDTYQDVHVELYMEIAGQLAVIVEKSRLYEELAQANRKKQEALVELQRSNRDLDQFASVISHDLNAPLRGVVSFSELLQKSCQGQLNEEAGEHLEFIVESAMRMQRLIKDLRAYSRLTAKTKPHEPVDCEKIFHDAVANLKVQIEEAQATITHEPLPTVLGDATQLMQLIQNLLGNAIKYRGKNPPEVDVTAVRKGSAWQFSIRDNGIGIDPKQHESIFKIFQRLHSTEDEYAGTGIGLAVCKRIVERHGGHIWLESEPGKGTNFFFTLAVQPQPIVQ